MFKPEYILDNVATFGIDETVKLIAAKFRRMGKGKAVAYTMAHMMVVETLWTPKK